MSAPFSEWISVITKITEAIRESSVTFWPRFSLLEMIHDLGSRSRTFRLRDRPLAQNCDAVLIVIVEFVRDTISAKLRQDA